jgi:D-alanyl-D-alanine carboxypeptidase
VNNEISFTEKSYIPTDLEKISGEFITDTKGNQTLRSEAALNLQKLSESFYTEFGKKLVIVSAYRSYEYQVGIKKRGCSDLYCAKAGYSEHQSGLAFDMFEASSESEFLAQPDLKKYFEWMSENAHLY